MAGIPYRKPGRGYNRTHMIPIPAIAARGFLQAGKVRRCTFAFNLGSP